MSSKVRRSISISLLLVVLMCMLFPLATVLIKVRGMYSTVESLNSRIKTLETELCLYKSLNGKLDTLQKKVEATQKSVDRLNDIEKNTLSRKIISRGGVDRVYRVTQNTLNMSRLLNMRATAYDLSVDSCGKTPSHPEYGITRTGQKVIYKTTVAVDPNTIPLGSVLYIEFPKPYEDMTGIYLAMDTGSAVKKDIIDIYVGKYNPKLCDSFGIQKVKVYLIG